MGKDLKRSINKLEQMFFAAGFNDVIAVIITASVGHSLKKNRDLTLELCGVDDNGSRLGSFLCESLREAVEANAGILTELNEVYGAEGIYFRDDIFQEIPREHKKNILAEVTLFIAGNLESDLISFGGVVLGSLVRNLPWRRKGMKRVPPPLPVKAIDFLAEIVEVDGKCSFFNPMSATGEILLRIADYPKKNGGSCEKPLSLIFQTHDWISIWATFNTLILCGGSQVFGSGGISSGYNRFDERIFSKLSEASRTVVIQDSRRLGTNWGSENLLCSQFPRGALYANVVGKCNRREELFRAVRIGLSLEEGKPWGTRPFKGGSLVAWIEGDEFAVVLIKCGKPEENEPLPWICELKRGEASAKKGEVLYDALGPDLLDAFRNRRLGPGVCSKSGASWDASLLS